MAIQVRYFARLREQIGREGDILEADTPMSAESVWQQAVGIEIPAGTLVAINKEYAGWESLVSHGDEIAFFPPVTGG